MSDAALHALLSPSSAARRKACAGSLKMTLLHPEGETEASIEGTAAHEVVQRLLEYGEFVEVGSTTANSVIVTQDMVDGALQLAQNVWAVVSQFPNGILKVEKRINISTIHPECWGTADVSYFTGSALYIWDYKFGHAYVEVYENWQMIEYVAGLLDEYKVDGIQDQTLSVHMRIAQPRCYIGESQIREWRVMAVDLRGHFNEARRFEAEAMKPDALCTVSSECSYCSARHVCVALQNAALEACDRAFASNPFDLPPEALGKELAVLARSEELLKARMTGLEAQVEAKLRAGERVPYWALGRGQGKVKWKSPDAEVAVMGDMYGVDLRKPVEVITPKQAEKLVDPSIVAAFSEYVAGGLKVVPEDNSLAARIFSK